MAIAWKTVAVPSYADVTIHNNWLTHDDHDATTLMALLPGNGYRVYAPLLHYCKMLGLQQSYDVLEIEYGYQIAQREFNYEDLPHLVSESKHALQQVSADYESIVLVGKSLGTPIASQLALDLDNVTKTILLTPINGSVDVITDTLTLAVTGTNDYAVKSGNFSLEDSEYVKWRIFDDLNHGLEVRGNVLESVRRLPAIIAAIEDFLLR